VISVQVGKAKIDRMGIWFPSKAIVEAVEKGSDLYFGHDNFSGSGFRVQGSERSVCAGFIVVHESGIGLVDGPSTVDDPAV
tara:strand:+ start:41 stop:283 length:243 start_codon:yes stop_codon:yes gene_type:complete